MTLAKFPVCTTCERKFSTVADHVKPWRSGPTEQEKWFLFCGGTNLENLTGSCKECHDRKTATYDGGFGHAVKHQPAGPTPVRTGEAGRQFVSSVLGDSVLDKALGTPEEIAALLGNV